MDTTNRDIQKPPQQQSALTQYRQPIINVILQGDRQQINNQLSLYKERGVVVFERVLQIPTNERIPALTKDFDGRVQVSAALSASITSAFSNINLRVGLNADQIVELSDQIIDQSEEDNLALEDVLLFLQQLLLGKGGKIYDRMDIPTFFELFENYRQDRYEKLQQIRYEQQSQFKSFGDRGERESDNQDREKELHRSALGDYMKKIYKDGM